MSLSAIAEDVCVSKRGDVREEASALLPRRPPSTEIRDEAARMFSIRESDPLALLPQPRRVRVFDPKRDS